MSYIQEFIHGIDPRLESLTISPEEIVFEERVRLACFNCVRYGVNYTCPPRIPQVDYKKIISEYSNALLVWCVVDYDNETEADVRRDSTLLLHRALLQAEKYFWERNNSLATSFIGGSCKLCAQGCAKEACRQPRLARIPVEAAGINVIETCRKKGLNISFPPDGRIYRIGLLLW
jgi:predicted metal-binding protein